MSIQWWKIEENFFVVAVATRVEIFERISSGIPVHWFIVIIIKWFVVFTAFEKLNISKNNKRMLYDILPQYKSFVVATILTEDQIYILKYVEKGWLF